MLSILLVVCVSMVGADISNNIVLQVTPVQRVQLDEQVLLECNMTSSDTSKVLTGLRLAWYDGFIPLTPVIENINDLKHQIVVNISVSSWLQYGRYVCKVEGETGTLMKKTAILPPGIEQEQLIRDVGPNEPGKLTISCPIASHGITWSLLTMNYTELTLDHQNSSFTHGLTSYDKSIKALCFSGGLYSIQYVYPTNYEPVRFIFPAKENATTTFPSLDPKLIECRTTGSLRPNVTWLHDGRKLESDIVRRLHIVEVASDNSPYVLQLNIFSPVPFVDSGEYVCVVQNKWEVVNRSIHIRFDIPNQFVITTYSPIHYLYNEVQFKATCIVQASLSMQGGITMAFAYNKSNDSSTIWTVSNYLTTYGERIKFDVTDEIKEESRWFIATLTISNVTQEDSGFYDCYAASFADAKSNTSRVQYFEVPLQIVDYEPEVIFVEEKMPVLLTCDIIVEDMLLRSKLFSIFFHFYANEAVSDSILYDANLQYFDNGTIRATLNISQARHQDSGIYECYVRTLPIDNFLISPGDDFDFYVAARNTTLNVTRPDSTDGEKSNDTSNRTTIIIVSILSIISAVVFACIIFLICYIVRKQMMLWHYKAKRLPSFTEDVNHLLPGSPEIPSETTPSKKSSLLMKEIVTSGWYFPHSDLKFEGTLGSGEFGIVMSALATNIEPNKPVSKVAVKILPGLGNEEIEEDLRKELAALSLVGIHKHVVGMMGASYTEGKLEIIVEFCAKGSLLHFLRAKRNSKEKELHPSEAMDYGHQIALGMKYLAEKKCVHCDLAARNVLITKDNILKVSDFGLARKLYDEIYKKSRTSRTRLPVRWMAIESIRDLSFTTESDVWAFGIVLWEIIQLGSNPYPGIENRKILGLLRRGYRMPQPQECPDEFYQIMRHCWKTQPSDRPSFTKLAAQLKDLKEKYSSLPHGYVNWSKELPMTTDPEEMLSCGSDVTDDEGEDEAEQLRTICPVHGRASVSGEDSKLLVNVQHSVDSGISSSTENIQKKSEKSYVNATNALFKIHDRLRLRSTDSGLASTPLSPTNSSCPLAKTQACRIDSGMPDSPCDIKTSPPYTNIADSFSHFTPPSPTGSGNVYCTDPTTASRKISAHPDNRPMFPALGIEESDV